MANPVTTTNNSSKVPDIDPRKAVINISAKPVLDGDNKQSQETIEANKAEARKDGENLAAVSEDLAIQPVLDQNGQVVKLQNPTGMSDEVIESIKNAEHELMIPENTGDIELDDEATGFWAGSVKNAGDAAKSLFGMVGGVFGDAIPAAKKLVEKAPTKKGNAAATHLGLFGAGLVGLSSLSHLVKAGQSFFGRKR